VEGEDVLGREGNNGVRRCLVEERPRSLVVAGAEREAGRGVENDARLEVVAANRLFDPDLVDVGLLSGDRHRGRGRGLPAAADEGQPILSVADTIVAARTRFNRRRS
jgi:hypothetical protein